MATGAAHYTLASDEGQALWFTGTLATIKASSALTGGVLSLVEFLHPPGYSTSLHRHLAEDEAFYVLEGSIRGINGEQLWRAEAGSFVWLPKGIAHGYMVVGDVPVRTLVLTVPSGFDRFVEAAGTAAPERVLPPPAPLDTDRLAAAAAMNGLETLGPLVLE